MGDELGRIGYGAIDSQYATTVWAHEIHLALNCGRQPRKPRRHQVTYTRYDVGLFQLRGHGGIRGFRIRAIEEGGKLHACRRRTECWDVLGLEVTNACSVVVLFTLTYHPPATTGGSRDWRPGQEHWQV